VNPGVPASRSGVAKFRDYGLEKYSGEARLDYRPSENTEAITTVGYSNVASALEITGTFYLRTGLPVVDNSTVLVGQLQQGFNFGDTKFTAGADYIATTPVTAGTIMGRNEDDDNITEMGGYLQFTRNVTDNVEFTGAVRGDMNSRIEGTQFSPRAAFVWKATPTQELALHLQPRLRLPGLVLLLPRPVLGAEREPRAGPREHPGPDLREPREGGVEVRSHL